MLAAIAGGKTMWYLTRGSGAVTLLLLTGSMCLGIAGTLRWRSARLPRFTIAALHRNLTLLAVTFLGIHIATTVLDSYTPIGLKDAFVPFFSSYRPLWLGLGALGCDLLLALVLTSFLRLRLGHRVWRSTHWLAYACWPVAFVHSLGTGSDPRAGWLQLLALASAAAILLSVGARLVLGGGNPGRRIALGGAAAGLALLTGGWYTAGPASPGWAARAGTPATLLHSTAATAATVAARTGVTTTAGLGTSFHARLQGTVTQSRTADGLVDVHLDGALAGGLRGRVRVVLEGVPLTDGGVSMTASGVAFAASGTPVYEGKIVGLDGNRVSAQVSDGAGHTLDLSLVLRLDSGTNALAGTLQGRPA